MDLAKLEAWNAAAFVLKNGIKNENGNPIEFTNHLYLAQPYMDNTPQQVIRKAGQVGESTCRIIRAVHLAKYAKANIIYTLPSKSAVKDFVTPKVDPLINHNPIMKEMIGKTDSAALKSIGDRFIYFRGSWEESAAISISAHILISDEVDRSNQKVLGTYRTRLDAAKMDRPDLGWEWKFSNPSIPGVGVDEWWEQSDQKHWFIKCSRCATTQYMTWPESVNIELEIYVCKNCKQELREEDRRKGHWIPKFFGREISGYWMNQMMVPWHTAKKIINDSKGDIQVFHNFTLGLPYQPKDQSISRQDILKCIIPDANPRTNVAMGVDNGVMKHYVVGNRQGIFRVGSTESWEEIEDIRNQYDAYMVIDANPYPTMPKRLAAKYRSKVFIHYYVQDKKQLGTIRWGDGDSYGVVESDRTKIIDGVVADISAGDVIFNLTVTDLDEYIRHWGHMYRIVEESESRGIKVPVWKHAEGKPDHFAHATVYWRVALEKTLSEGKVVRPQQPERPSETSPIITNGQAPGWDIAGALKRSNTLKKNWFTK